MCLGSQRCVECGLIPPAKVTLVPEIPIYEVIKVTRNLYLFVNINLVPFSDSVIYLAIVGKTSFFHGLYNFGNRKKDKQTSFLFARIMRTL